MNKLPSGFPAPMFKVPPPLAALPPIEDEEEEPCTQLSSVSTALLGPMRGCVDAPKWTFIPMADENDDNATRLHAQAAHAAAHRYTPLIKLLVSNGSFRIAEAICRAAPTNMVEHIINPLVSVFISTCVATHYMAFRIERVVDETVDKATLFRSKTFTTVLLSVFAQSVAQSYLKQVVRPLIASICSNPHSLEVDPSKATQEENVLDNTKHLIECLEECFEYINKTIERCPHSLWVICQLVYELVKVKFESTSLSSVGGLFFLRFLCPALVNPGGVGLTIEGLGPRERRNLVLVSKTLQSLSNGIEFGGKESYMMGLNKFIRSYRPRITELLEKLSNGPPVGMDETYEIQGIVETDCVDIHKWLVEHRTEVSGELQGGGMQDRAALAAFDRVMEQLGEPTQAITSPLLSPGRTQMSSWKTSELPPELAAALLEVELGSKGEKDKPENKVLYEIESSGGSGSVSSKKKKRGSVGNLLFKRRSSSSGTNLKRTNSTPDKE
eukprot:TRINITY_DN490_c0_g1_i1.p1 TRINITY_DN490_c0_g1~~TRINITY_DN490_c0_g1_i1.p1  ORF type:complete len:498 (-),score=131.77 TRINITY_DN490_c0_g1_i1:435-1928(-)